jgi:hypothetical protein
VAAWTDIDRSNGDQSDIALRPISLDATCEVPRDAATRMSITTKTIEGPAPTQRYTLRGRIVSLDRAGRTVTVDAEAIPGFMGAMMMSYPVKNERLLDSRHAFNPESPLAAADTETRNPFARG